MGKGASGASGAHDYFGTIAGLVCAGPVNGLVAIAQDKKVIWPTAEPWSQNVPIAYAVGDLVSYGGRVWRCALAHTSGLYWPPGSTPEWEPYVLRRTDPGVGNPAVLTVLNYGTAILYWGTPDQVLDVASEPTFAGQHPPYRRQCFVILKDWLFGRERTSAPNIEFVVTRAPRQAVITGNAAGLDAERQANPLAFLAEVVTDPVFGLGQDESLLDAPSWQAAADALTADAATTHLSPVLNKGQGFRAVVEETLSYFDGWLRYNRAGQVEAGRWAAHSAPPAFTPETTLDFHDLVEEVAFEADSWAETYGAAVVKFTDRERAWKPNAARAVSGLNRGVTGMDRDQSFDRPWVSRAAQASLMAAELARVFAEPGLSGTLTVRREKCAGIQPGSLFLLTHDVASLSVVCRCEGKVFSEPPSTRVNLRFRSERRLAPVAYQPAPGNEGISTPPVPEVISLFEFLQPPAALAGADHRLLVLAARTSATTVALRVHLRQADGTLFYELGRQTSFAVLGTLQAAYPDTVPVEDDSETFRVTLDPATVAPDLIPLQETQSADAVDDDNLLAFVLQDDCYPGFEILTVKEVRVAAGESFYRLKVRRARFGTPRRSFGQGNRVWIIHRASLVFLSHSAFESYAGNGTTAFFRLQPRNLYGLEADLADPAACPDRWYTFHDPLAPEATLLAVERNGTVITDFTVNYALEDTFSVSLRFFGWHPLASGSVFARQGSTVFPIWSGTLSGSTSVVTASFTLPAIGSWDLLATVTDATGRQAERALCSGGVPVVLRVQNFVPVVEVDTLGAAVIGQDTLPPAIELDTLGVTVIGLDPVLNIELNTLAAAVLGQETLVQAVDVNTLGLAVVGQDTLPPAVELNTLGVAVISQETLGQAVELNTLSILVIAQTPL